MADSSEDRDARQLPASERKLRQARERGQVPRSREAAHAAALIALAATIALYGPIFAERCTALLRGTLRFDASVAAAPGRTLALAASAALDAFVATLPLLAAPLLAAAAATLAVGGRVLSLEPLAPQWSRVDPVAGLGRLFSVNSLIETATLAALASWVGGVGAWFVAGAMERFVGHLGMALPSALAGAASELRDGLIAVSAVVVIAALVDGPVQVWRWHVGLRMTPQEVKQEQREVDGDPHVKARVRERQRAMSRGRMLAAVPAADVVVTNPTHYAVALRYADGEMSAPRVVAKGADLLAARIREIAERSGVPLLESPPLARALYRHVEVDREIPAVLYSAVAQVLAWVHQLQQHRAGRAAMPRDPGIELPPGLDPQEAAP
jgi:flagellar biosynthetic protein FlhB